MTSPSKDDIIENYGYTAVERNVEPLIQKLKDEGKINANPVFVKDIEMANTPLVKKVMEFAQHELPIEVFNHSMRVYYYGVAISQHLPTLLPIPSSSPARQTYLETYLLTSLLHDLGCTPKNLEATLMSFEFYGGFLASKTLVESGAPTPQMESVVEAIIRHQDLGPQTTEGDTDGGMITLTGRAIQLATIFDNMTPHPELVHKETIEDVCKAYPRRGWSGCFARTIRRENGLKPWAHTTSLGERAFPEGVEGNEAMAPYEKE